MPSKTITLSLELHLSEDALTGLATDGNGTTRPFSGWIGLMGAIDMLVSGQPFAMRDAGPLPTSAKLADR